MVSKTEIMEMIIKHWNEIKRFGVKRLWLFGSYAKGEQSEKSDIDILVEFEKGKKTFDNYMDLKFFLEDLLGAEVDLITVEALKPGIKDAVWKEAVPIEGL
ncbi:nucleotidyltransferase family protein [Geoglobus acetivorans]|uniref:protein adenylyltransferase n=1 Tax=Geoglobus acetivorans TaxID=565033 RepID=A0A0A7GB31_GEOAI|nr:PAP/25A core domain:DNA polymerase, beta-like region [Geoglobus acetivorans]